VNQAYIKTVSVTITLMKLAFHPNNYVAIVAGNTPGAVQRGVLNIPGNSLGESKPFRVAFEIKKFSPTTQNMFFDRWEIKLAKISNPSNIYCAPTPLNITRRDLLNLSLNHRQIELERQNSLPIDDLVINSIT
jgi:hypothetical protein